MPEPAHIVQILKEQKLLPLFYHKDAGWTIRITEALYAAGIRAVEYTSRGEYALTNFQQLVKAADSMPGLEIGIGTVKTAENAKKYMDAGASFIISPIVSKEIADAINKKLLWIPGCMTPTEIALAESLGISLVKIFPGNILGPGFISAIKDLFPGMSFIPTGGVEPEIQNLKSWFNAGVCAVGMGSRLILPNIQDAEELAKLTTRTKETLSIIQSFHQTA
jgi:2-dehydro-3-deoxyphosphogluconate aldolase / (4S)-4-hydroxy-2-oxoglutarate aldolase